MEKQIYINLTEASPALSAYEKVREFNAGRRRENVKACGDQKLINYYNIAVSNGFSVAEAAFEAELINRGLQSYIKQKMQQQPKPARYIKNFDEMDFHQSDAIFVAENDINTIINNCEGPDEPKLVIITLIFLLCLGKPSETVKQLKDYIVNAGIWTETEIKDMINNCLKNPNIISRLNNITKEVKELHR